MANPRRTTWRTGILLLVGLLSGVPAGVARGGGGPENVFLVVNRQSWASQTLANHYINLRQIPPGNVLYLDWTADVVGEIDVNAMRDQILLPVLTAIERRRLVGQIDAVIYSSDFPYSVNVNADGPGRNPPLVSLTSLTYLWALTLQKQLSYLATDSNFYARQFADGEQQTPTRAFNGQDKWNRSGEPDNDATQALRYLLSTMIGYTSGRGTSVGEAIAGFERNVAVDGTKPKGTIYLVRNSDVRSRVRHDLFPAVVKALEEAGVKGEILNDAQAPAGKDDIQGAVMGWAQLNWAVLNCTILPGAIVEHLTSFGGYLGEVNRYQTAMTDFLRYGAAGSSGTVSEPQAILAKFPHPFVQVHYARGCSLAESFYQSVAGPGQLLIVGDPLCQPWAEIPTNVAMDGAEANQTVSGTVTLTPTAEAAGEDGIGRFELFVDGRLNQTCDPGGSFSLDTTRHVDGYHALRLVAVGGGLIAPEGRLEVPLSFDNFHRSIELDAGSAKTVRWGEPFTVKASSPDATRILLYHNSRLIETADKADAEWSIEPQSLGLGPTMLRAIAYGAGGAGEAVVSQPIAITVEPPPPLPADSASPDNLVDGLVLKGESGPSTIVADTKAEGWLTGPGGIGANDEFTLNAFFEVPVDDVYQFQLIQTGRLTLSVDGREFYRTLKGTIGELVYVPVSLAAGEHELLINGKAGPRPYLDIRFGGPGATHLGGGRFRHRE